MALIGPSEDPPREPPKALRKVFVSVRGDSCQQAFQKVTRLGLAEEQLHRETRESGSEVEQSKRWQFMGINDVVPIPSDLEDGQVIGDYEESEYLPPLEDVFRECDSYWSAEDRNGEEITGTHYRTVAELDDVRV